MFNKLENLFLNKLYIEHYSFDDLTISSHFKDLKTYNSRYTTFRYYDMYVS